MENRDDKDLYHSLSKKELQELCRRYGLSPYMTKPNLVDALYSYLKRKNVSPIFQVESSSVRSASLISPPEYGSKSYNMVHARKDGRWNTNHPGEKRNRKIYSQNVSCREKQKFKGAGSYNKASGSRIVRDLEYPLYEVGENFPLTCKSRATFDSRNGPGCNENHFYREKPPKISFNNHSLSFPREAGERNAPLILSTNLDHGACLAENASTSSLKSTKSIPSFEFYIRSEEGINLVVDLNSSLSDWSNRLESGLCCHNLVDNKFGSLRKEIHFLGKSGAALKGSFLQNTDAEHELINGCVDSSKKEFDNIVVDHGFGVDEEPLLFSSPNSVVQNHVTSGAESNPTDRETIRVESSVKSSTNCLINPMLGGLEISLEHQILEVGNKNCEDLTGQNTCTDMGPSLVYPGSFWTGSTEMQSPEVVSLKDDSCSPCGNNNLPDVIDLTLDVEARDDELAYSSTSQDHVSACVDEMEKSEVMDGVQTSE